MSDAPSAARASPPTGAQDDRTTDSGAIGFPCAKTTAGPGARAEVAKRLRDLGVKGILVGAAELGYITEVKCGCLSASVPKNWVVLGTSNRSDTATGTRPTSISHYQSATGATNASSSTISTPPTSHPRSRGELCIDRCPSKAHSAGFPPGPPVGRGAPPSTTDCSYSQRCHPTR